MAVIGAALRSRSRRRRRSPASPPDRAAAAGVTTCSSCAWLKRVGRGEPLSAWSTRGEDHCERGRGGLGAAGARAAAAAAAAAALTGRWPTSRTDGVVEAATRGRRRMRRGRPSSEELEKEEEEEEEQQQQQQHRSRRPQLRRRQQQQQQQQQQQREASQRGRFQHHPDDTGWYMRQYCADRAASLRCKLRGGGASGPPLSDAAAECSSCSSSAATTGISIAMRSDEAAVRSNRSHSSAPLWPPRLALEATADASWRRHAADSISQRTDLSESALPDFASRKGAAIDKLVEKLMRRRVSSVSGEPPEPLKLQLAQQLSSTNSTVRSTESADERQPTARSAAAKRRPSSPHAKVLLPAATIDVLERFGLGSARDRTQPPSTADDRDQTRSSRLLPVSVASGDALGYVGTMPLPPQAPRLPFKAKTMAMAASDRTRAQRACDDARASAAASLDEAPLAIAPDNRPFLEKTKPPGARAKLGGNRLRPRAAAALHTVTVANGAFLRDRNGGLRRQELEPATTPGQPPGDGRQPIESEESILLNMLCKPLVACFLNGSDRVAAHVGDLPGQMAQACLVDYSGYWSVQSP